MVINIKQYLKETNSVLLTKQAYKYLIEKASVIEKLEEIKSEMDIIAELEKIICELRNCYPSMPIFNKRKWQEENKAYLDCESIIFKHISELKGENK